MTATLRNQGSLALAKVNKSQEVIAQICKVSRVAVAHWLSGAVKPLPPKRKLLKKEFGIDEDLWDKEIEAKPRAKSSGTDAKGKLVVPRGRFSMAAAAYSLCEELYTEVTENRSAMTTLERVKILRELAAAQKDVRRDCEAWKEGDAETLETPWWKRVEAAINEALKPYPDAAKAVAIMFGELKDDEARSHTIKS